MQKRIRVKTSSYLRRDCHLCPDTRTIISRDETRLTCVVFEETTRTQRQTHACGLYTYIIYNSVVNIQEQPLWGHEKWFGAMMKCEKS